MDDPYFSLSPKRRRFIEAYLETWNASEAARRAGYKTRANSAGQQLMSNPDIRAAIDLRLQQTTMQANEILKRLDQQGKNEAAAYIQPDGEVDLPRLIADGKSHLIKGIKYDRRGKMMVEFYDAQAALIQLGRAQRVFVDQVAVNGQLDQVTVNVYLPDNGRADLSNEGRNDAN